MPARSNVSLLKASIRDLLIPEIERRRFARINREALGDSAPPAIFPFGQHRREFPGGMHLLEIQLEKYGAPAFRINLGIAPQRGIDHRVGHVALEDIWVHYLDSYWTLYRSPRFRIWFRPLVPPWRTVNEADFQRTVRLVVNLMGEVDAAFFGGGDTPHIRRVG